MSMSAVGAVSRVSVTSTTYDPGLRRRSLRRRRERGCTVYIPAEVIEAAGYDLGAPPPYYRLAGYHRSANGHTVIVSLYREP